MELSQSSRIILSFQTVLDYCDFSSHAATSEEGIAAVISVITDPVCAEFTGDADCVEHVTSGWNAIAPELFNQHDGWFSKEWLCAVSHLLLRFKII